MWLHVLAIVQNLLGLRVTEALNLKGGDFDFDTCTVHVFGLKGHGQVSKPMLPHAIATLTKLRDEGAHTTRSMQAGRRGHVTATEKWAWQPGLLFRQTSAHGDREQPMTKDTVARAIARARRTFTPGPGVDVDVGRIRSHSARHRFFNDSKLSGVSREAAMTYGLLKDVQTYEETYGKLSMKQAAKVLGDSPSFRRNVPMPSCQPLAASSCQPLAASSSCQPLAASLWATAP